MSAGLPGYDKAALRFFIILSNLNNILKRGDGILVKFFSFGKAKGKQSDDTTGKYRTITEEEYQRYMFEDELFKMFGLTPSSRSRIMAASGVGKDEEDEMEALLGGEA